MESNLDGVDKSEESLSITSLLTLLASLQREVVYLLARRCQLRSLTSLVYLLASPIPHLCFEGI